jgi:hypothetical protein
MNWAAWSPTIIAVLTAVFVAGQVKGRINGQEKTLAKHDLLITGHGVAIAELKAWRDGYNAALGRSSNNDATRIG